MWTIEPKIPLALWWALTTAAATAVAWYAMRRQWPVPPWRRAALTALLLLGVAGPLIIALNPTWVETIPPLPGKPLLTVLVDGTVSMQTQDVGPSGVESRWRQAVDIARTVASGRTDVEVRHQVFADSVHPLSAAGIDLDATGGSGHTGNPIAEPTAPTASDEAVPWPRGHRTDLASALRQTMRTGSPVGHAILVITDGAHNVGSVDGVLASAREAHALATPIYSVTLGTSLGMKNMAVTAKASRMIAFPDKPVAIRASIGHNGLAGQRTDVALIRNDQVLQTRSVRLGADPNQEVRFVIEEGVATAIERFRIVASEVLGEATSADNQTTVLVQRLAAPVGVLVLEGKPYWDSKFLSRNLANDPVVDLTAIVQLGPKRFLRRQVSSVADESATTPPASAELPSSSSTEPSPTDTASNASDSAAGMSAESSELNSSHATAGESQGPAVASGGASSRDLWSIEKDLASPLESMDLLQAYRVVILGRDADAFLTEAAIENLREWISQSGGCLLCSRGPPTDQVVTKLSEILPIQWVPGNASRFRTQLSTHGFDSSVFDPLLGEGIDPLGSLPSLATAAQPRIRIGLPQVLVESSAEGSGERLPVVTYQPYGRGQTVVVEGAGMWRWAFLPPEHAEKDAIYPTLWQSMIQWIISQQDVMPGQEVAIRSDRANFLSGDRATASVTLRESSQWMAPGRHLELAVLLQAVDGELPRRLPLVTSGMENGLYRVDLGVLDVGYYALKVVTGERDEVLAATAFDVRDPWFESLEVDARPDIMRQVARLSGGQTLQPAEVSQLVGQYAEKLRREQNHQEIRSTLWDRPWVLLAIFAGWIATWVVRRQNGLI